MPVQCGGSRLVSVTLSPRVPPVSPGKRSMSSGNATASANVTSARLMPRMRSAGRPTMRPTMKHSAKATMNVVSGFQLRSVTRMPVVYAPMPKNAE